MHGFELPDRRHEWTLRGVVTPLNPKNDWKTNDSDLRRSKIRRHKESLFAFIPRRSEYRTVKPGYEHNNALV